MTRHIAFLFLSAGIFFLLLSASHFSLRFLPISFFPSPSSSSDSPPQFPVRFSVDSLRLSLPIFPASFHNGSWEQTTRGVSFLLQSSLPGETGNSVLYGHNWPRIFGKLRHIQRGDTIGVSFANGTEREFSVRDTFVVSEDQTHILSQTSDSRLTIFTCTGFFDRERFVVVAVPLLNL